MIIEQLDPFFFREKAAADSSLFIQALFRYTQKLKTLQNSPSHQILRHMHETLNIDKKDN